MILKKFLFKPFLKRFAETVAPVYHAYRVWGQGSQIKR